MNNINSALFQIDKFDTDFFRKGNFVPIYEDDVMNKVKEEMSIVDFLLLSDEIDKFIDHEQ